MFEAAQSTLLTTLVLLSPWRLLWKRHCPEQPCLGQRSSCQKCSCTVRRGERHCRGLGVVILCFSVWLVPLARVFCGFAVLLALLEVMMWEAAAAVLWDLWGHYVWPMLQGFAGMRFSSLLQCRKHVCALLTGTYLPPVPLLKIWVSMSVSRLFTALSLGLYFWRGNVAFEFATEAESQLPNSFPPIVKCVLAFKHFKSLYPKKNTLYAFWKDS